MHSNQLLTTGNPFSKTSWQALLKRLSVQDPKLDIEGFSSGS